MGKLFRPLILFGAIAALLTANTLSFAPAQVKDKDKDKTAPEVGTIEVYTDKAGEWRFRVKVDDKSIAIGTVGHEKKEDTLKVIETLKATMAKGKVVEIKPEKK